MDRRSSQPPRSSSSAPASDPKAKAPPSSGGAAPRPSPRQGLPPGLRLSDLVSFPPELPITASLVELVNAIVAHPVIIVAGETGSGKTTQLPKICLAMGRGANGQIGCTQPRRIAASSVATRVAEELDTELGDVVGYKVRFGDRVKNTSYIKFMTDGILLAEIQSDPLLRGYDTIIIDEAHERSLNIDFLLGFLKRLVPRRPDLRIIVSSATLETERFSAFFDGAPVIEVSGRTYPVDVLYRPLSSEDEDLADAVANTVSEIAEMDPRNDVLVFLPGEREIREAMGELEKRSLRHTVLLPLYARLSAAEQQRVFQRQPQRRVVLATNVAETSLTIPGIVYVVDAGVARVNRYNVRTGVSQLLVEPISRASADQRKGRCGRTESGVCFRLYEEKDYESRPAHTDPEIKRVSLAGVILRMKALRLGDIENFPFLDPPQRRAITEGYRVLEELGALHEDGQLTTLGEQLGKLPVDPRLGRMILGGRDEGALREVLVIAAALGLQDPRERPQAAQQRADEAHRKFKDEGSDFAGYLKLWAFWQEARARSSRGQMHRLCRDNFLSYNRMREWEDIHDQLVRVMRELDFAPNSSPGSAEQIHRALLPGLLSKIGMWNPEARIYVGARQTRFMIHPSSGLARKPPLWVMAAELVETSQLFARTVAKIDPAWLEKAAGPLCQRSYGDPHWEQKQAQAMAKEQVMLYGLPIIKDRKVAYGRTNPVLCRAMFITHALVRHEYTTKGEFMEHNRRLLEEVHQLRDKARRSDMLADEYELELFFERRLPDGVISGKTFEDWRREAEAKDPTVLHLSREDILLGEAHDLAPERYPDALTVSGARLPLTYKFDPGEDDDGITLTVPLAVLPQLDPAVMSFTIPGWHQAKLLALLESLPKPLRKTLAPLEPLSFELATRLRPFEGAMLPALERAIHELTGERVPRDAWDLRAVPVHLGFGFRVIDERDKVIAQGRDLAELQRTLDQRARALWGAAPRAQHERAGLKSWDFESLPVSVTVDIAGRRLPAYPALVDAETAVDLRLLESPAAAAEATRGGVRRLLMLQLGTTLAKLEAQLPGSLAQGPLVGAGWPVSPRRQIVLRALDESFRLDEPEQLPRSKAAFAERLADGRGVLSGVLARLGVIAVELSAELDKARGALKTLAAKPGFPRAVHDDLQTQLAHLAPPDLMQRTSVTRLGHIARYAKAICVRLQRQANDPPKDLHKATQVTPLWQGYLKKLDERRAKGHPVAELEEFGWLVEELRVQVFAPELKTAVPISPQRLQDLWNGLSRHG
ncbi:MAG TPA: ATP-dependent RNA helicase HrpA [Kofleriaceae bacterium]|nr:ATP-dependent RNA helicase HrpA [Kofleriaceae bacterium]